MCIFLISVLFEVVIQLTYQFEIRNNFNAQSTDQTRSSSNTWLKHQTKLNE